MTGYSTKDLGSLLGLKPAQVRALVRAGLLQPQRGAGRRLRFSFEDLVFVKAAKELLSTRVRPRRIRRGLVRLRSEAPDGRPPTSYRLSIERGRLVVGDEERRWHPESGQILLDFEIAGLVAKAAPITRRAFRRAKASGRKRELSAEEWFSWGCELEEASPKEAREAYERALQLDPAHVDANVNLGRLVHEQGDAAKAEEHYRRALETHPDDSTASFNLGVALEDLGRLTEAVVLYERAAGLEPANADAHFNAANLYEALGDAAAALRHLKACRALIRDRR